MSLQYNHNKTGMFGKTGGYIYINQQSRKNTMYKTAHKPQLRPLSLKVVQTQHNFNTAEKSYFGTSSRGIFQSVTKIAYKEGKNKNKKLCIKVSWLKYIGIRREGN